MAKKKIEEPVYPASPLVIPKEKFTELLTAQIEKGKVLLGISVPQSNQHNPYVGYMRQGNRVEYDEAAQNDFFAKFNRWHDRNKEIYRSSFEAPNSVYFHDYESQIWSHIVIEDIIKDYKEDIARLINQMQADLERIDLLRCIAPQPMAVKKPVPSMEVVKDKKHVFIVHGHNEEMKQTVARVVTNLGLIPIILHEQANEGRTIIDKFEANAENINFAIILLSGDDFAVSAKDAEGLKDEELRQRMERRARQNVVFEMGYFAGKLGRSHMFYLLQEGVAKPGDLDGLVYTPYDAAGAWKFGMVKELKACGYNVDANNVL